MTIGIYKITNVVNGDYYIGSSSCIERRISKHKNLLANGKHHSYKLQNAYIKYGQSNFEFSIIETINDREELCNREQYYISCYNPKYNILKTAYKIPELSKTNRSIYQYDINGKLIKEWKSLRDIEVFYNKQMPHISSCINNKRKSAYGYQWSVISNANNIRTKNKVVQLIDVNNVVIKEYNSLKEAGHELGMSYVMVREYCKGTYSPAKRLNNNILKFK